MPCGVRVIFLLEPLHRCGNDQVQVQVLVSCPTNAVVDGSACVRVVDNASVLSLPLHSSDMKHWSELRTTELYCSRLFLLSPSLVSADAGIYVRVRDFPKRGYLFPVCGVPVSQVVCLCLGCLPGSRVRPPPPPSSSPPPPPPECTESTESTESTEYTEHTESIESTESTESTESSQSSQSSDSSEAA